MADEASASVKLEADTTPWEKSLNEAAEKARGWGDKVSGYLERANDFSSEKLASYGKALTKLSEQSEEDIQSAIGKKLGGGIGAAIGTIVGPGIGTMIGKELGEGIGENLAKYVDLSDLTAKFGAIFSGAATVFEPLQTNFAEVQRDAGEVFKGIKDDLKQAFADMPSFGQLLHGEAGAGDIVAAFTKAFESIGTRLNDLLDRTIYRVAETIDQVFEKVQEPLGGVLDFLQNIGVQLGLLEDGAGKWGDAVREASDVGRTAVGKLGYAFGAFEGAVKVIGGYAFEYIGSPYMRVVAAVYNAVGQMVKNIAQALDENLPESIKRNLPAGMLKGLGNIGGAIQQATREVDKLNDDLTAAAKEAQGTDILANARRREQDVLGRHARGKDLVDEQRERWEEDDAEDDEPEVVKKAKTTAAASESSVSKAVLAGSQEAANMLARAQTEGGPAPTLEKLAAFAATQNAKQAEANTYLRDILAALKDRKELGEF